MHELLSSAAQTVPRLVRPAGPRSAAAEELVALVAERRDVLKDELQRDGAVLFRGFAVETAAAFDRVVRSLYPGLLDYVEGNSPRARVSGQIYTSTSYPPEYPISLHSELSYAHRWPSAIAFFCRHSAAAGGETPIADCRTVLARIPAGVRERFVTRGVRYVQSMHGGRGLGKTWQDTFETSDRRVVEDYCAAGHVDYEWRPDGGLRTVQVRPAVRTHPETGAQVWFNQADQWHPSNLDAASREALLRVCRGDDLPLNATYADGGAIADEDIEAIRSSFDAHATVFPWERGDVLILDNMLMAHGRRPYRGHREVLVAMA